MKLIGSDIQQRLDASGLQRGEIVVRMRMSGDISGIFGMQTLHDLAKIERVRPYTDSDELALEVIGGDKSERGRRFNNDSERIVAVVLLTPAMMIGDFARLMSGKVDLIEVLPVSEPLVV